MEARLPRTTVRNGPMDLKIDQKKAIRQKPQGQKSIEINRWDAKSPRSQTTGQGLIT